MTDKVHSVMLDNQKITIREHSDELGLSFGLVQSISDRRFGHETHISEIYPKTAASHVPHRLELLG
jgi:hypothetical protein